MTPNKSVLCGCDFTLYEYFSAIRKTFITMRAKNSSVLTETCFADINKYYTYLSIHRCVVSLETPPLSKFHLQYRRDEQFPIYSTFQLGRCQFTMNRNYRIKKGRKKKNSIQVFVYRISKRNTPTSAHVFT